MTKTQIARVAILSAYLAEFANGARTLKQLAHIQDNPSQMVNDLIKQGYVVKVTRGVYKWISPINKDYIQATAKLISTNWHTRNVYGHQGKLIGDYTSSDLISEINRRNLTILYDPKTSKYVIK